ncbi:Lipid droplet-associated hydrolase-like protein [Drosera capensis]
MEFSQVRLADAVVQSRLMSSVLRIVAFPRFLSHSVHRPRFDRAFCKKNCWAMMAIGNAQLGSHTRQADFRICNVSGYMTELLEIESENPRFHVLLIPGNPGIVTFYKDFVESLFGRLGGSASVTAIGHICHTSKDWEQGRLFSLEEQIIHKMDFIDHKLQSKAVPIILVPDSISDGELACCSIGIVTKPAIKVNRQEIIGQVVYHTIRNMLFMARTEFSKLSETPDWDFMRAKVEKFAFVFGEDDHWGPLSMLEKISKQVPGVSLSIEREGHMHAFSCSEAVSWSFKQKVSKEKQTSAKFHCAEASANRLMDQIVLPFN